MNLQTAIGVLRQLRSTNICPQTRWRKNIESTPTKSTSCCTMRSPEAHPYHHLIVLMELPICLLYLLFFLPASSGLSNTSCPFNFTLLHSFLPPPSSGGADASCQFTLSAIHLLQSDLLQRSSRFLTSLSSAPNCWSDLTSILLPYFPSFDPRLQCGFATSSLSLGCMNISSRSEFEAVVPPAALDSLRSGCNSSLQNGSPCASCTTGISLVKASFLSGPDLNNVSDCASYPSIYAAAFLNPLGPSDPGTASCLFFLELSATANRTPSSGAPHWIYAIVASAAAVFILCSVAGWCFTRRRRRRRLRRKRTAATTVRPSAALESIAPHTTLVRFTLEEIMEATGNFATEKLIGKGAFGNVYRGVLPDGEEVAVKRSKNCSASGDAAFAHEIGVIASVRHVNLVALRGYCIATSELENTHHRLIVCELMKNGSLHDHLFGLMTDGRVLSWPVRRRIALGMARGLAYLHCGAQPKIIHRDIKASNILLDENFEPKLADFGLAKFAPEGASHLSTRVAGTLGYVAPEYALYGKLSEKSDVYSFGVVLLELLSGKKAVVHQPDSQPWLLTDWAWSLVRENRALDVVDNGMEGLGPMEVVEKFVLVAVLCSHPHLHARPSMDQAMNMLETESPVLPIPDRPISLISDVDDIEKSVSGSGSGQLTSLSGYQPFAIGVGDHSRSVF